MAEKKPGLSFLEDLTPEQWEMARLVGETAKRFGVSPRLAIAVAFEESRLGANTNDGSSGEIGVMQVMPSTGQTMGYSPKDLRILEKNIEAGVRYLKQNLDQFEGNEGMAVAAYNTGPGNVSNGVIPQSTRGYLSRMKSWGAFDQPKVVAQAAPEAPLQATPEAAPESDEDMADEVAPEDSLGPGEEEIPNLSEIRENDRAGFGMLGAGAGAALGSGVVLGKAGMSAANAIKEMRRGKVDPNAIAAAVMRAGEMASANPMSAPAATQAPGMPPAPPGAPSAAPAGAPGEQYPRATGPGQMTANYARAAGLPELEAGKALGMGKGQGEVWDLMNKRAQALTDINTRFPSGSFAENPAYGGIMTPSASVGSGPKASFVQQAPEAPTLENPAGKPGGLQTLQVPKPVPTVRLETKTAGALEQITRSLMEPFEKIGSNVAEAGRVAKPVLGALSRVAVPAAAGYSIGQDVGDIYGEYMNRPEGYQPNKTNIGLSALGALGTGVSLVAPLSPLGLPLAVGAPTARYVKDRYQQIRANPQAYQETMQGALSNVDPMGAPLQ